MKACASSVVVVSGFLLVPVFAQSQPIQTEASTLGSCFGRSDLAIYTVRSARVVDPFWILRRRKLDTATLAEVKALETKPYSFQTVDEVSRKIEAKAWLPDSPDTRANLSYSDIAVENCVDQKLDVIFHVFSASISPTLSSLMEWRTKQVEAPHEAAGVSKTESWFQIVPEAGFEPGRRFFGGGAIRSTWRARAPFHSIEARGSGSTASRTLGATIQGAYDSSNTWLTHAEWLLDFGNALVPAATRAQFGHNRLAGQFLGLTRPFRGVVLRFGGMLDGGSLQSSFQTAELSSATVSNTHYTSSKLYGGMTGNWRHQAYAVSYGIGLGSTGNSFHGGWRKQIGDVSHQIWLPFGQHRLFEFEQRWTAGGIQSLQAVPVAERFFGGNFETPFLIGTGWNFRSNPVVRSIPANRLYRSSEGAGGDRFFSYNSTTALTVWGRPVVPKELADDPQFQKLLNGAIQSQSSILQVYYKTKDSHFQAIRAKLPETAAKLDQIRQAKDAAQTSAPESLKSDFKACSDALDASRTALQHAVKDKPVSAFGWVPELLPDGLDPLADVVSACGKSLATKLAGASISASALESGSKELDGLASLMEKDFQSIDSRPAAARAEADLAYVQRTLDVITKQMTITSVSPVFVFDVANLGLATGQYSGNRYGIGGGLRFTLVSTAAFTLGYAVNHKPRPGEGTGAFFFCITTRNPLD